MTDRKALITLEPPVMLKLVSFILFSQFIISCASNHRKTTTELRAFVKESQFEEAIALLKESSMAKDEKSKLLFHIELALLEHYRGNYLGSVESLNAAKIVADDLYTKKVSASVASSVTNDNANMYYGEKYEHSLIYFYLSLNYFLQSELELDEAKRKTLLLKARSEVLAWDSYITEMKQKRVGSALFKEDLLSKTFGAFIHEAQGNFKDDQIALQLYTDAEDVFFKNYNLFPTFNAQHEKFRENFSKLHKISLSEVERNFVKPTAHHPAFKEFLHSKILYLTKKIRPQELKAQVAKLKPSPEMMKKLHTPAGNVTFLVQDGLIAEKIAKKIEIPFVWNSTQYQAAGMIGVTKSITFELPTVEASPRLELARLEAINVDGTVAGTSPLSVIAPLGELASQAINEHSTAIAAKTAARITGKYVAAILATSAAYRSNKDKNPGFALMVATLGHAAAIAAINESEKADLRYWGTLPSSIRMGNLSLPMGTYKFRAVFGQVGATEYRVIDLGEQTVSKNGLRFVMNGQNTNLKVRGIANLP